MVNNTVLVPKLVAYERVSTARQGRSGLGLEAQRKAIEDYTAARNAQVLGRFTEVESGRRNDRPQLEAALNLAKLTGATLVIAKLDRLSRNAAFLLTLRDAGVRRRVLKQAVWRHVRRSWNTAESFRRVRLRNWRGCRTDRPSSR